MWFRATTKDAFFQMGHQENPSLQLRTRRGDRGQRRPWFHKRGKMMRIEYTGETGTLIVAWRVVHKLVSCTCLTMRDYTEKKMRSIEVPRGDLSHERTAEDGALHNTQATLEASTGWAEVARPDLAAPCSTIPGSLTHRDRTMASEASAARIGSL